MAAVKPAVLEVELPHVKDTKGTNVFGDRDQEFITSLYINKGSPLNGAKRVKITVEAID